VRDSYLPVADDQKYNCFELWIISDSKLMITILNSICLQKDKPQTLKLSTGADQVGRISLFLCLQLNPTWQGQWLFPV